MDTSSGVALSVEEIVQSVTALLGLDENQSESVRSTSIEQVEEKGSLVALFYPDNLLGDVLTRRANSTNC